MRTIDWIDDHLVIVDQTALPGEGSGCCACGRSTRSSTHQAAGDPGRTGDRRGRRPRGGAGRRDAAAVTARRTSRASAGRGLRSARPTAVNLAWAVDRVLARLGHGAPRRVEAEAMAMLDEDVAAKQALSRRGARLRASLVAGPCGVQTHCNAGGLAAVEWGTALGIVRALHEDGVLREVFADETRPLLQGAGSPPGSWRSMGIAVPGGVDGAGAVGDRPRAGRRGDRRRRPGGRQRRRGQQDRHLPAGAGRGARRHPVRGGRARVDRRPGTPTGAAIEIEERDAGRGAHSRGRPRGASGRPGRSTSRST